MTRLNDPRLVAEEYASEERLRRRAAAFRAVDPGRPNIGAIALGELRARDVNRVLEVGCGWGELAALVARETRAEITAVDISPRMVELARARGVAAEVGDVQALRFEAAGFDCVVAAWMLYHVPDIDLGLAEIARVLRPGGLFLAVTNSAFHLAELRELVGSGLSPSTFTRENGEAILRRHFGRVDRSDYDGEVVFATREDVADYVAASISMSPFADRLPERIDEPFVARRAVTMFLADKES